MKDCFALESRFPNRVRLICGLLLAAGVAVLVVYLNLTPRPATIQHDLVSQSEVPRMELELRTGRLHHIGSSNAFTGVMVDQYTNGTIRSRSAVANGQLHGLSEGRYPNGQLQVSEHFKGGVSHGLRTKWYPDGTKLSEAMIVDGKMHGEFRRWHTNGELAEVVQLDAGRPVGLAMAYYPGGSMKSRTTLRDGKVVEQKFWKDGEYQESVAELKHP